MKIIGYHATLSKNVSSILRDGLVPSIPLDMQTDTKAVYLFVSIEELENAMRNWLGERFGEEDDLTILEVDITGLKTVEGADFEHVVPQKIEASRINIFAD